MAYTTDKTWAAGAVVLASELNTYLRDNMKWLSTDKPMCVAYSSVDVSTNTSTLTPVAHNQNRFDNSSMHNTVTNNTRITFSTGGKYLIGAQHVWQTGGVGTDRVLQIRANGSTVVSNINATGPVSAGSSNPQQTSRLYSFASTDYIEHIAWQDTGVGYVVKAYGNYSPEFWAMWVGV